LTIVRNFTDVTLNGGNTNNFQWDNNYFDGGTEWNDEKETDTESLYAGDSGSILRSFDDYATNNIISWPDYHPDSYYTDNFKNCDLRVAMCCFIDNRLEDTPLDPNADVCNHALHDSKQSNRINRGFAVFESRDEKAYCNAFSWDSNEDSTSARYAGNTLFYISMYSGLYENGFVENIPSSPLCGCIEQMATVDDTDCTKATVTESYNFKLDSTGLSATMNSHVSYDNCDTEFMDHYKVMATKEEVATLQSEHIVDECTDVNTDFVNSMFYVPGPLPNFLNLPEWEIVVGEGKMHYPPIGDTAFRALIEESTNKIIWRKCLSCDIEHKEIYYKRLTTLPPSEDYDFLDMFMNNWYDSPNNVMGVDFDLYFTYDDALAGIKKWTYCDYNKEGYGFPRSCGYNKRVRNNWNSYVTPGGVADHHAFYVEKSIESMS